QFPEADAVVETGDAFLLVSTAACQQTAAVWRQGQGANARRVNQATQFPARCQIPQPHGSIDPGTDRPSLVGREQNLVDPALVPDESAQLPPGGDFPEPDRP